MKRTLSVLAVVLLSTAVAHADVLDQSQTNVTSGSYFAVGTNPIGVQYVVGQVFTAGMDGYLERVQVLLENDSASPVTGGLLLSVQTVTTDGLPSGREIASDSIAVCADPAPSCVPAAGSPGWVEFSLPPAIVSAGTRYALVLRAWGGGYLRWYYHVGPSFYTGGYAAGNNGSGWFDIDYDDATFRTYVEPPVLDQSQTAVGGYKIVDPQHPMAQTFVPAVTGYLRRIRLLLENQTASSPIAVSILLVDRAHPSAYRIGTEIAGATIPVAHLPSAGYPGWVDVTLDYLWMVAGTEYAVVLSIPSTGSIKWFDDFDYHDYSLRTEFYWEYIGVYGFWNEQYWQDAAFETYVLPPVSRSMPPPPREISPCINLVCPETKGGLTPADFVDGIKTHFLFKEKLNGTVGGTFSFTDEWPDGVSFQDCTTESNTCRLSVSTFKCTGPNAMTVAGSFKRAADTYATSYELNLTGTRKGSGTIILKLPKTTYTFTHDRIVEVSCP